MRLTTPLRAGVSPDEVGLEEVTMHDPRRAPEAVLMTVGRPAVPEPFEAEYGPLRDEVFAYIRDNADQQELADGEAGQHFEW